LGPAQPYPACVSSVCKKKLSVTTVLQAYNLLESQGLIEARPRSGYYVSTNLPSAPPEPMVSTPELDPTNVSIRELLSRIILHDALNPNLIHLGAAFLPREISATRQLNRLVCSVIRKLGDAAGLYDMPPGCLELRTQISRRSLAAGMQPEPPEPCHHQWLRRGCQPMPSGGVRAWRDCGH
jgi:DNA-binding transcriptional MocR family regulator